MPKLRVLSGRDICAILIAHGFTQVRQSGSHIVMQKRVVGGTVTVPVPNHSAVRRGTLMSIIRQSGIPREIFMTD